jgi:transposase
MARTRATRRCFGLDVHRDFAQVAIWQNGVVTQAGTFPTTPEQVRAFADSLEPRDEVALEATGNAWAIATVLTSRAGRVVVSNPAKTRAIAEAKIKTDKVDAAILANLLAADYLPPVWLADADTAALRRQVLRRAHIVRQRTRLKNRVHAILHANLVPSGGGGRGRPPSEEQHARDWKCCSALACLPSTAAGKATQPATPSKTSGPLNVTAPPAPKRSTSAWSPAGNLRDDL